MKHRWRIEGDWHRLESHLRAMEPESVAPLPNPRDEDILAFDPDWRIVYVNDAAVSTLEVPREDMLGEVVWEKFPFLVGSDYHREALTAAQDGSVRSFSMVSARTRHRYEIRLVPNGNGITSIARQLADAPPSTSLIALLEASEDAVVLTAPEGTVIGWNRAATEMFGLPAAEAVGQDWASLLPAGRRDELEEIAAKLSEGHAVHRLESMVQRANGKTLTVLLSATPLAEFLQAGVGACWVLRDTEPARRTAAELQERDLMLRAAIAAGDMGTWSWDVRTGKVRWSDGMERIYGLEPGTFKGTIEAAVEGMLEEDRPRLQALVDATMEHGTDYRMEYRIRRPSGELRWLEVVGRVFRNERGEPDRLAGVMSDITDRKTAELELKRSREELAALFENASIGIHWVGPDGTILWANQAELDMLGYPAEEYVGRKIWDFHADREVIDDVMTRLTAGERLCDVEARLRHRDGRIIYASINSSVLWEEGRFIHTQCFSRDITDQKRTESIQQAQRRIFEAIVNGRDQRSVMELIVDTLERTCEAEAVGAVMLLDEEGYLNLAASPSLDPEFSKVLERVYIGPERLAVGSAQVPPGGVVVTDIATDDRWAVHRDHALRQGFRTCWTGLIRGEGDRVLGILPLFCREARPPTRRDRDLLDLMARSAGLALQRLTAAREQAERDERLRLATAAARLGVFDWRVPSDTPIWEKDRMYEIFGRTREQGALSLREFLAETVVDEDRERFEREFMEGVTHDAVQNILCRVHRPGESEPVWLELSGKAQRDAQGEVERLVGVIADVTERERSKAEIRENQERLRLADRRKDEFLATLAHELRNPLAPIGHAAQLVRMNRNFDGDAAVAMDIIERQTRHMTRLIDDLLDVSRITQDKIQLRKEAITLQQVVQSAVEACRPQLELGRHRLQLDLPEEPIRLVADFTRLSQIVSNLLTNAAKYTPLPGTIRLTARLENEVARVQVSDNGIGLAPEMLEGIFDLFTQVEGVMARSHGGLGIGLTVSRKLAELHGGRLEAASEGLGRGSTFTLTLPAERPAAPIAPPDEAPAPAAPGKRRVLVVDDNRDMATALRMYLTLEGNEVTVVHDGLDAIEQADILRPDVVLLDIGLPGMSGLDVAPRLREILGDEAVLIAITGWGQAEDRRRTREAGFDHHLTKPFTFTALAPLLSRESADVTGGREGR